MTRLHPALESLLDSCNGCGCLGETHAHRAEQALRAVLVWCDTREAATREWEKTHNPECDCSVAPTTYQLLDEARAAITKALEVRMSTPHELLEKYFSGYEFPVEHCPRRRQAPRAEDALRAVLDECDRTEKHADWLEKNLRYAEAETARRLAGNYRAAITAALDGERPTAAEPADPQVTLARVDALDPTGSVSYAVTVDGLPVGYVGDSRQPGHEKRLVRRWFACSSVPGDPATVAAAAWDSGPAYRTRMAAIHALTRHVQGLNR